MKRVIVWSYLTLAVALAGYASAEEARVLGAVEEQAARLAGGREAVYLYLPAGGSAAARRALLKEGSLLGWLGEATIQVRSAEEADRAAESSGLELIKAPGFAWPPRRPREFALEDLKEGSAAYEEYSALLAQKGNRRVLSGSPSGRSARNAIVNADGVVQAWIGEERNFADADALTAFSRELGVELVMQSDPLGMKRLLDVLTLQKATDALGARLRDGIAASTFNGGPLGTSTPAVPATGSGGAAVKIQRVESPPKP